MRNRVSTFACFFFLNFCIQAQVIPYGEEFQVNTHTEGRQSGPAVSYLSNGGFIICWTSDHQDSSDSGIYGQLYDNNGTKQGSEFRINTYTKSAQWFPKVTSLHDEGFVACWTSADQDGSDLGIFAQLFNNDGTRRGPEFQVNTYTRHSQSRPAITNLPNDNFVICWNSDIQDGSKHGIYGQLFNNNGTKQGQEFQVNTYTEDDQDIPEIYHFSDGGFVICWRSIGQDESGYGIYGQSFNSNGQKQGQEFQVNTYTKSEQISQDITVLADDSFIICWTSNWQDGSYFGVYAQLFNRDGKKQGSEFLVNTYTNNSQRSPAVGKLSNGGFVICWSSDGQDGSNFGIYGQLYTDKCLKIGAEFQVNGHTEGYQMQPVICHTLENRFIICWQDNDASGNRSDIFGRYYSTITTCTNVADPLRIIDTFTLSPNYPNPFNPKTTIAFTLNQTQYVDLSIIDTSGRIVTTLKHAVMASGNHKITWDASDQASGIYFVQLKTANDVLTRKMILAK